MFKKIWKDSDRSKQIEINHIFWKGADLKRFLEIWELLLVSTIANSHNRIWNEWRIITKWLTVTDYKFQLLSIRQIGLERFVWRSTITLLLLLNILFAMIKNRICDVSSESSSLRRICFLPQNNYFLECARKFHCG